MKRFLILLSIFSITSITVLEARGHHDSKKPAYKDMDMDGVVDRYDRCPHTPFFALVNKNGCTIKRIYLSKEREKEIKKLLSSTR